MSSVERAQLNQVDADEEQSDGSNWNGLKHFVYLLRLLGREQPNCSHLSARYLNKSHPIRSNVSLCVSPICLRTRSID